LSGVYILTLAKQASTAAVHWHFRTDAALSPVSLPGAGFLTARIFFGTNLTVAGAAPIIKGMLHISDTAKLNSFWWGTS